MLSWQSLGDPFGREYANPKDFKKEFRTVLRRVWLVDPTPRIEGVVGGILLKPSPPPIPKTSVSFALPRTPEPGGKSEERTSDPRRIAPPYRDNGSLNCPP